MPQSHSTLDNDRKSLRKHQYNAVYKSKTKRHTLKNFTHTSVTVENTRTNKRLSETIKFYNSTKFGINMTDQMAN